MLRIGALNHDSDETAEPEPSFEIIQEAQQSEALGIYHKALALQKGGDLREAEKLYSNVLETDLLTQVPCPSDLKTEEILENSGLLLKYTVYKNLGDISYGEEDYEKALDNYLEAALIDESDVSLWWRIGDIALKVTNLKLARYSFEKGLIYNPNHWPCLDNLVSVLFAIGDYAACLEAIIKSLEKDNMFTKGLVIRDQIFKEEAHFRKDYQEFHILFENENREDYIEDEYSKYIEEALVLREKRCLLARKEDLQSIKLTKPLAYYTWACFGDCLIHQYDELTNPENPQSLCRPLDIAKYEKTAEQQSSLAIPSPEASWRGAKQFGKDEERKGLKRKKVQSTLFEKDIEPVVKRRSARVKSSKKEEDVNWADTLQNFLPEFLRADSATENEDSQDSTAEEMDSTPITSTTDLTKRNFEEAKLVSDFINKNVRNSGCIDLMSNFTEAVANQSSPQDKWYHGLPQIYCQVYKRVRKHIQFPFIPPSAGGEQRLCRFAKMLLFALEIQLDEWLAVKSKVPVNFSPGKPNSKGKKTDAKSFDEKPKGADEFLSDIHFLMFITSFENVFQEFWVEFITRFYWLEARFFMLIHDTKQSIRAFDKCIDVLTPGNGITNDVNLSFRLENCSTDSVISLGNVQKRVEALQRCLSLQEVNKLYEDGKYSDVVELLMPFLKQRMPSSKDSETTSAPPERPTQLLFLQDSLSKLGQIKKCIICSELAINEAIQRMTPTEDWKIVITGFLDCLNREKAKFVVASKTAILLFSSSVKIKVLTDEILANESLQRNVIFGLVQSMIRIIEVSMECLDTNETVLATTIPWLILYKIAKSFDPSAVGSDSGISPLREMLAADNKLMPPSFLFIKSAHDLLGRRGLCCDDEGALLLAFTKDLDKLSDFLMPTAKKDEMLREFEQCFYCLYGHPSKKTKSRKLQDHVTSQTPLTWQYSQIVYEYFKPSGLPTLDNKINTISMEVQLLLRRIVAVVPQKDVEVISFDSLQSHIDGIGDFPTVNQDDIKRKRTRIQDLFYYLADYYFKNKEFSKAIKFYMHDVCLNPTRFQSWAAMALARGSRLEEKISAHEPKSDGPIRKNIVSTLRCFEKAVELNNRNCMILEEYGSTSYMLNSQAARRLRELIQDEEYTAEAAATLTERRNEMIRLSEKCFTQAKNLVKKGEGEPWLHSYMLGKTSERLQKSPDVYLNFFRLAAHQLYTANANYPKRIPYHNPPEYSIESLEMYYRMHASILKTLERTSGELNYTLIEEFLDTAEISPFVKGVSRKQNEKPIVKEEPGQEIQKQAVTTGSQSENKTSQSSSQTTSRDEAKTNIFQLDTGSLPMPSNNTHISLSETKDNLSGHAAAKEPYYENSQSLFSEPCSQNTAEFHSQSITVTTASSAPQEGERKDENTGQFEDTLVSNINVASQPGGITRQVSWFPGSCSESDTDKESQHSGSDLQFKFPETATQKDGEEATKIDIENPETRATATIQDANLVENKDFAPEVPEKTPSLEISMIKRNFTSKEEESRYKTIVDRCLQALSFCLKRFPEHYKSQYKIAFVTTYYESHKDLSLSRELLLGTTNASEKRKIPVPQHGIFSDRSKTNLFQYLWRIPIDEIDRRGSFCSHICKAVELLLHVLSELKEWDTLLTVSGLLHLTPAKDKKYLRDNDRLFLALKAFDIAKDILKTRINMASCLSRTDKKLLLLDCYEAYRHAQKMQTSVQITEHFLTKIYRMLLYQPDSSPLSSPLPDKVVLDQALRFCITNAESGKKLNAATSSTSGHVISPTPPGSQFSSKNSQEESKKSETPNLNLQKQS